MPVGLATRERGRNDDQGEHERNRDRDAFHARSNSAKSTQTPYPPPGDSPGLPAERNLRRTLTGNRQDFNGARKATKQRARLAPRVTETAPPQAQRLTPLRLAAVAVVAVLVAVGVWLLVRGGGSSNNTATTTTTASATPLGPVAATQASLVTFAKALKRPIYWAGPVRGDTYEFTETSSGNIFVRYLPKGVRVGDPRAAFRVVATYPYPGALAALSALAGTKVPLKGGGLVLPSAGYAKSVHIAYPGIAYEIEVFDPVPGKARAIAVSGQVRPIR